MSLYKVLFSAGKFEHILNSQFQIQESLFSSFSNIKVFTALKS